MPVANAFSYFSIVMPVANALSYFSIVLPVAEKLLSTYQGNVDKEWWNNIVLRQENVEQVNKNKFIKQAVLLIEWLIGWLIDWGL